MLILWLSQKIDFLKEIGGFARAFERKGTRIITLDPDTPPDVDVRRLIERCPQKPSLILHPEPYNAVLPRGLTEVDIPTAGFQTDVYAFTHRRFLISMLFDYALLLHPGFDETFLRAGHPAPITLPLAVDAQEFFDSGEERIFDVACVGRTDSGLYSRRREVLSSLSREFEMNDWSRSYAPKEVPPVYRASKIVLNIPRNDYSVDVSMRFAEAMISGALFLTSMPSEMTLLGFEENVHFSGYRDPAEIRSIIRRYLNDEPARACIAHAGREKVLREHTYDARVEIFLRRLAQDQGKLFAPARRWLPSQVGLSYLDYYAQNALVGCAAKDLWQIVSRLRPETWQALHLFSRPSAGRLLTRLKRWKGQILSPCPAAGSRPLHGE